MRFRPGAVDDPRRHVVGQSEFDDRFQFPSDLRIVDRGVGFDPVVDVARHPVGRSDIVLFVPAVAEDQDARVFQVTVDDAADFDAIAFRTESGDQGTVAPHQQADTDAGREASYSFWTILASVMWLILHKI